MIIESTGAEVRVANAARAGLSTAVEWNPDVVWSDIAMPGGDGFDFIRDLRAQPGAVSRVPVIAITAYGSDEYLARSLRSGFHMHLSKPIDLQLLLHAIGIVTGRL